MYYILSLIQDVTPNTTGDVMNGVLVISETEYSISLLRFLSLVVHDATITYSIEPRETVKRETIIEELTCIVVILNESGTPVLSSVALNG